MRMVLGHRHTLLAASALVAALSFAPSAQAVTSGPWKGGDIEFRVKDNRVRKVSVVAFHTCQVVGTGEFFNQMQRVTPPGSFKIGRKGGFLSSRYVNRAGDYFDISFAWRGRFRKGRMRTRVQTSYKYYAYYGDYGYRLTSCYSERVFRAKPRR